MSEDSQAVHWSASSLEREVGHSRRVIANAKVVVTFSAGIAAAFVTAAMHDANTSSWDEWAMKLMGLTLVLTIVVVLLPPGHHAGELTPRSAELAKRRGYVAHWLMVAQVGLSLSCVVAAVGIQRPEWQWFFGWP